MKTKSVFLAVLFTYFVLFPGDTRASSYVPLSHRVYDFLERMEHYYLVSDAQLGTKPVTRKHIADILAQIKKNVTVLSAVDKEEYECLTAEFLPDISSRKGLVWDDKGPVGFCRLLLMDKIVNWRLWGYLSYGYGTSAVADFHSRRDILLYHFPDIVRRGHASVGRRQAAAAVLLTL